MKSYVFDFENRVKYFKYFALMNKGNQHWTFIGRNDAEAPVLWPPLEKSQLTGKDTEAGKDWRQEEKRATEDKMVGWNHGLNGHSLNKLWETVKDREAWYMQCMGLKRVRHGWITGQQMLRRSWGGLSDINSLQNYRWTMFMNLAP